jgi:hypothetical protein
MNTRCSRWMLVLMLLVPAPWIVAADPLEEVDQSAREWVKLRVETTRLDTAWRSERELVESTLTALKERAALLEEKRDLAKARTAQDRAEFDALRAKSLSAGEDLRACEARLQVLTGKLAALRPNLPPRLSEVLEMSYRSLAAPGLPFGERLQVAVNVLNRCAQFNRLVTAGEDMLALEGEPTAKSFEVIYWGLSHGYALDRAGHKTWIGMPGPGGWRWEPSPDAFAQVVELLAVARDKADPAFVVVPATVAKSVTEPVRN